ncbi:uncharacterized protein PHACADRAFT_207269 [Phanerochaete carnosa HHB-10118-sp]|uniref:F-box domain-containing protein n=1 Tax=Phanerochaete carnosa (strain HHB-10118-sp) TaxID=650164 RepID=K5W3K6_PHACS|nr:uncharacterized protein PHACADRAFT_207269 [Phanerochaete carnosa HHB-10118-sp]EKM58448.1 hypothetical protein PHACADRAFT_207269 [Phanerochaete carnosa HHB-10118-sp]
MHRCFQIPEIADNIVYYVNAGFINVALVSRSFYEPAMNAVWRKLDGIEPLVRLLPESLLEENDGDLLVAKGIPSADDWSRFRHHASRVRELRLSWLDEEDESYCHIDFSVYRFLRDHSPFEFLFPNLQELSCYDSILEVLDLFIGPSVKSLTVGGEEDISPGIFSIIVKHGQQLCELRLLDYIDLDDEDAIEAASRALSSLNGLTTLKWNCSVPEDALLHLARLPTLTNLTCALSDTTSWDLLANHEHAFSSLHKLVLLVSPRQLQHATSFLSSISPRLLVQLEICIGLGCAFDRPASLDIGAFTTLLASISRIHTLISLELKTSPSSPAIPGTALSPLFDLSNLRRFHTDGFPFTFVPADIHAMSKGWRKVQKLRFSSSLNGSSTLSLNDLLPFAANCPDLTLFAMRVSGSPSTPTQMSCNPQSSLKLLDIGGDVAEHTEGCSAFLSRVFPHVRLESWSCRTPAEHAAVKQINEALEARRPGQ